jgi:hypothetical protein
MRLKLSSPRSVSWVEILVVLSLAKLAPRDQSVRMVETISVLSAMKDIRQILKVKQYYQMLTCS